MNVKSVVSLLLSLILLGTLVVSLATPWYWIKYNSSLDDEYGYTYFKYNGYKQIQYLNGKHFETYYHTYDSSDMEADGNSITIYIASLAFTVLALVVVSIFIICMVLQIIGKNLIGAISKFIPIISLIFCLIAMFIFISLPNARKKDCERAYGGDVSWCNTKIYKDFIGAEGGYKWGPSEAFIFSIISSVLNLTLVLVVILLGIFNNTPTPQ